jgi:hypothetical protein
MNKNKYNPQIGTFAEFYKPTKKRQSIKENSSVGIEVLVPFWNDAIKYALDNLRQMGGGGDSIEWNTMVDNIKLKFSLLNIFDKSLFTDDSFVIAHVKDIIYHNYCADGYLSGDTGGADNYDAEELGAKAFVISKLADTVLKKAREESGLDIVPEPEEPQTVATVSLESGWGEEDFSAYEQRQVAGFERFSKFLKEGVDTITCQDDGRALDYVLDQVKKKAGSLKLEDIQKVLDKQKTTLKDYLTKIARDYLSGERINLNGEVLSDCEDKKNVLKVARKLFAHQIAEKAMGKISKENKEGK